MEVLLHDLVKIFVDRLVEVVNRKQVVTRVSVEEPLCAETPILHPYSQQAVAVGEVSAGNEAASVQHTDQGHECRAL